VRYEQAWWSDFRSANPHPTCSRGGCPHLADDGSEWCADHASTITNLRDRLTLPKLSNGRGGRSEPRPYPLSALIEHLGLETPEALACAVSTSVRTAHRLIVEGMLTELLADRLCQRAGVHPGEVWGDLWWYGDDEAQAS
jgi:hypothetical protein